MSSSKSNIYICVFPCSQKERRSKKRVELNSPPPHLPKSSARSSKRKAIIPDSEEEEEEEEDECPLVKWPKGIPRPQPPSTPSSADPQDQLQFEPSEPVATAFAVQSPFYVAEVSTNPSTDIDTQPIIQLRSLAAGIQETSNYPQQIPTPRSSPALIVDEELEAYFNAPITHPPSSNSSPVHHHLQIIEEGLQKPFPLDSTVSSRLE